MRNMILQGMNLSPNITIAHILCYEFTEMDSVLDFDDTLRFDVKINPVNVWYSQITDWKKQISEIISYF